LLVVAEPQQRRTEHVEPDDVHELRRAARSQFLVDDDLLDCRTASASELRRPCPADEPGLVARALPAPQRLHPVIEPSGQILRAKVRARQECADLIRERAFRSGLGELHRTDIVSGIE